MKKTFYLMILICAINSSATAQSKDELSIKKAMSEQVTAWNNGDIKGLMLTYWQNDSVMFIGKSGVTYGWQNTFDNYKKGYPDTAAMGKLDFKILETKKLSAEYYFVVGQWYLTRSIGDIGGHFTLLFKKIKGKWLIIADHSS